MTSPTQPAEPTATSYGLALAHHIGEIKQGRDNPALSADLIEAMTKAPISNMTDVLALVTWAAVMMGSANALMPDDEESVGGPKAIVGWGATLATRAREGLEQHTGIAGEVFTGSPDNTN